MDRLGALILFLGGIVLIAVKGSPWALLFLLLAVVGARAAVRYREPEVWQPMLAAVGGVFVLWFLLFGWMSEFPGVADLPGAEHPSDVWFYLTVLVVTGGLGAVAYLLPTARPAWTTGAWTWWLLTMWVSPFGRASSDWNLAYPVMGLIGLFIIGVCEVVRVLTQPAGSHPTHRPRG